jgi:hypothetical protein
MTTKEVLQLAVSALAPFIAAGGALWLYTLQHRERVSCFLSHGYGRDHEEVTFVGIHNRSTQPVVITAVRYRYGVIVRRAAQGTAIDYEDPIDLGFPYTVQSGEVRLIRLDEHQARRLATQAGLAQRCVAWALRRSRLLVECQTTTGARYRTSGEKALPWLDQLPWKRG